MKRIPGQLNLFNAPPTASVAPTHEFQMIVSHSIWLGWSPRQQFAYCAARDRDSARLTDSEDERAWYLERASYYDQMARGL